MKTYRLCSLFALTGLFVTALAGGCTVADERPPGGDAGQGGGAAGSAGKPSAGDAATQAGTSGNSGAGSNAGGAGEGGQVDPGGGGGVPNAAGQGGEAGSDAGMGGEAPVLGNREIALWPMPNTAGLPHPAQYDTSTPGITVDRVTGLTWEAAPVAQDYKWADAKAHCEAAVLGGFSDWRLPTRIELYSIVDYTTTDPAINATAFPACESGEYWSATPSTGFPNHYELIDFLLGYGYGDIAGELKFARCVRGAPDAVEPHYSSHAGYVTDNATGLNWEMPAPAADADYATTVARCDDLTAGGISVWRLPTIKELQTLIDVTKYKPAMDTSVFTDVDETVEMFWSSTPYLYITDQTIYWLLQDDTGTPPGAGTAEKFRSRCVFSN